MIQLDAAFLDKYATLVTNATSPSPHTSNIQATQTLKPQTTKKNMVASDAITPIRRSRNRTIPIRHCFTDLFLISCPSFLLSVAAICGQMLHLSFYFADNPPISDQLIISLLELATHVSAVRSSVFSTRVLFSFCFCGYFVCAAFAYFPPSPALEQRHPNLYLQRHRVAATISNQSIVSLLESAAHVSAVCSFVRVMVADCRVLLFVLCEKLK